MFLMKKYIPKSAKDAFFHKDKLLKLEKMAKDKSISHIIFYGPEGCGQKMTVSMYLEMLYGEKVNDVTDTVYKVCGSGNSSSDVIIKQSDYHIVIDPTGTNYDRYLIRDVVQLYIKRQTWGFYTSNKNFKVVLINNADNLSHYGQTALRTILETYTGDCRFIMWCNTLSKIFDPLRSRCYCFRLDIPNNKEIFRYITTISAYENIKLTLEDYDNIISKSDNDMKKILWLLDCKKYGMSTESVYDKNINEIVDLILRCKTSDIVKFRNKSYPITITNYKCTKILKDILDNILKRDTINDMSKIAIIEMADEAEYNLIRGRHDIVHIESFIVKIMKHLFNNNNI